MGEAVETSAVFGAESFKRIVSSVIERGIEVILA